jgi:hypothetical protein
MECNFPCGNAFLASAWHRLCEHGTKENMKILILTLAILGTVFAASQGTEAATVVVREYNWDHPYWHHHHYGYWHHHRGYWAYRDGAHVFIAVP